MASYVRMTCPHCQRSGLKIRTEHLGRQVLCKHCGSQFVSVAAPEGEPSPSKPSESQVSEAKAPASPRPSSSMIAVVESRPQDDRLHALQDALDASRAEVDRLWRERKLTEEAAGRSQGEFDQIRRERDEAVSERARLERDLERARSDTAHARAEVADERERANDLARRVDVEIPRLNDALAKALAAERLATARAETLETRLAERSGQPDQNTASHDLAIERDRNAELTRALTELEQRLAATLDLLTATAERAERAESQVQVLRDSPATRDELQADDPPEVRIEILNRQLQEARKANQTLSDLLGVFGAPKLLGDSPSTAHESAPS